MSDLVVFLLGTDHHRFDRLVDWADAAAGRYPAARVVVQHGATHAPRRALGHEFLAHTEIVRLLSAATAVVCHGGPGTIMDARHVGHVPICVPRDPARGEHVDAHQQRFAEMVDRVGVVRQALTEEAFERLLDDALSDPARAEARLRPTSPATELARARVADELDQLARPASRTRWGRPRVSQGLG